MEHRSWGSAENSLGKSLERITVALTTCLIRSRLSGCTMGMKIRPLSQRRTQLLICRLLPCPGGSGCWRTFSRGRQACGTPLGHQNKESTWVPWWQLRKSGPERPWQGLLWKVPSGRWGAPPMAGGGGAGWRWHRPPAPSAGLPSQRDLDVCHINTCLSGWRSETAKEPLSTRPLAPLNRSFHGDLTRLSPGCSPLHAFLRSAYPCVSPGHGTQRIFKTECFRALSPRCRS